MHIAIISAYCYYHERMIIFLYYCSVGLLGAGKAIILDQLAIAITIAGSINLTWQNFISNDDKAVLQSCDY